MAWSRLEKVGTIFSRVNGLIRAGALKEEDKPLWYELYKRFPPIDEPRYDRPAKGVTVRKLFYPEDIVRAKYHKLYGAHVRENLADHKTRSKCQRFIETYYSLKERGGSQEDEIFDKAAEMLGLKNVSDVAAVAETLKKVRDEDVTDGVQKAGTIVSSFKQAHDKRENVSRGSTEINIKDIFKDG